MKLLTIKPITIIQNGILTERYEVRRSYTEEELVQLNLSISPDKLNPKSILEKLRLDKVIDKRNEGVLIETFNSAENANWFADSISLIKPVLEVLDACKESYEAKCLMEDYQSPSLMIRTPRNLDLAMGRIPKKLLKDIDCNFVK